MRSPAKQLFRDDAIQVRHVSSTYRNHYIHLYNSGLTGQLNEKKKRRKKVSVKLRVDVRDSSANMTALT